MYLCHFQEILFAELSVVTGLTTTDIGPTSCHVTWNRLIGGEKYLEYDVRVGDVSKNRKVQMSTTKNSTLKIQGLSPNRDYTIEVEVPDLSYCSFTL